MRVRDRKSVLAALATLLGYAGAMGFGLITLAHWLWPWIATPALVTPNGWIAALLIVNAAMLGWRLAMRFAFTASVYGPAEGLRAIPRAIDRKSTRLNSSH